MSTIFATSATTFSRSTSGTMARAPATPDYAPLQWATDYEVRDLRAALAWLRNRPDHDPAGFGLVGVSRGDLRPWSWGRRSPTSGAL